MAAIVSKGYETNFSAVDNDPYKETGYVTASAIEEKLREKIAELSSRLRDSAMRCKIAKEKLVEAREREIRTKEYRKELRLKVIQAEETLKLKERLLKDFEERFRYKNTFIQDSRKMSVDMTEIQVEVDKMTIQLSAAKRKYNDSYREWQKIRAKHKELDKKLREKENEGDALEAKSEQLQIRLQATKEGMVRMEREQAITSGILQEQKEKNREIKVKYKEAWERKLDAMKKIAELELRITQITQMTETVQKDRLKAEQDLVLGFSYTKFEGEYVW